MPRSRYVLRHLIQIVFLLLGSTKLWSQSAYLTVSGSVFDQSTGKPVPYAHVGLFNRGMGTVTNAEGVFVLKLPLRYASDTLQVSSLGYRLFSKPLVSLNGQPLVIQLVPAVVDLAEVQVRGQAVTGADLLRQAIAAIPENYDTTSVQLTAFYREDVRLEDYPIAFNEAVLDVYKSPYGKPQVQDGVRILKGRKKPFDHSALQIHGYLNLGGGHRTALYGDFVKHSSWKHSVLNEQNFKYYDFKVSTLADGDQQTHVIDVRPSKKGRKKALVTGKLYLDSKTLAFTRAEWQLTPAGIQWQNNQHRLKKKLAAMISKISMKLSGFEEVVTYQPYQGKWYLSTVERRLESMVHSPSKNILQKRWQAAIDFTTTQIGAKHIPAFTEGDIGQDWNSLSSLIGDAYDEQFWQHYNTVQPLATDTAFFRQGSAGKSQPDSLATPHEKTPAEKTPRFSNRTNGFTRADTLRGKLTPARSYDVTYYHLDVEVDINRQSLSGSNTIRFRVVEPLDSMQVDLYANMAISKILYRGKSLAYSRDCNAVFIRLPNRLQPGTEQDIEVFYSGMPQVPNPAIPMHGGFMWKKDQAGNPWVQVVCQGSGASLWWPCKDHLSDEPDSMRISVTVPDPLMDISNGTLQQKIPLPGNRTRYDWQVSYPINNYNVTLNVGKYVHQQDSYVSGIAKDTLVLNYYVLASHQQQTHRVFSQVKPMLAVLEQHYGPYPFPRDGFTLMESLYPMEHQSAVSFGPLPEKESDYLEFMRLTWHEVSHEWWGNSVSCKDMADFWLHEAFATYSEGLYWQQRFGKEGIQGHLEDLATQVAGQKPILGEYDVNHIHYNIGDLYSKGALLLHTFRNVLQDDQLWQQLLLGIQREFKHRTVTTQDIVGYINHKTGQDYSYFFDQYLKYPTLPTLQYQLTPTAQSLLVKYRWKADVVNFRMPIRVSTSPGKFNLIYPTTSWQTITLKGMQEADFEVDESAFYVATQPH